MHARPAAVAGRFGPAPPADVFPRDRAHTSRDANREYILAAFGPNNGNRTLTAQQLEVGHAARFRTRDATVRAVVLALRSRSSGAASSSSRPSDGCGRKPRTDARRFSPVEIVVAN